MEKAPIALYPQPREKTEERAVAPSPVSGGLQIIYFTTVSHSRMRMMATWARVALPWGFRVVSCLLYTSQRNYNTMKNKKNTPDRLEMNKYCPFCRKHTVHSETK